MTWMAGIVCALAQASDDGLRWRLETGDVLQYAHRLERSVRLEQGGRKSTTRDEEIEAIARIEVERVTAEGKYVVRYSLPRLRVVVNKRALYDSHASQKGSVDAIPEFRPLLGKGQTFTVSALGQPAPGASGLPVPLAMEVVRLPEQTRLTWSVVGQETLGPARLSSETVYRLREASNGLLTIECDTVFRVASSAVATRLRSGRARQKAVFDVADGALSSAESEFAADVEWPRGEEACRLQVNVKQTLALKEWSSRQAAGMQHGSRGKK